MSRAQCGCRALSPTARASRSQWSLRGGQCQPRPGGAGPVVLTLPLLLLGPVLLARACRCPALRSPGTGKRSLGKAPGQGPLPLHLQSPIAKYTPDAC